MSEVSKLLAAARQSLHLQKSSMNAAVLENFASMFLRLQPGQLPEALAEFHNLAWQFPYANDSDFGALLLEAAAEETSDRSLAKELLQNAEYRARWCAQGATSGGEGMARSIAMNRIRSKLDRLR